MATTANLPPDLDRLAAAHRARQQAIAAQATAETNRLWGFLQTLGWAQIAEQMVATVRSSLAEAARGAQQYAAAAVGMWGLRPDPAGRVAERSFALTASDGRPLATLLEQPSLEATAFAGQGMPRDQADAIGRRHLQRIVATQVADAARVATGVAIVNERKLQGYIRHLTLPSCNRCILLAGQWYRWNDGFERHPLCDCVHIPAAVSAEPPSPRDIYDRLSDEERRNAGWSGHDQRAIDDGADLFQVTNYKRALKTVTIAGRRLKTTTVGATRRGLAGKRGAKIRLTPEAIYQEADRLGWTRNEAVAELKRHAYIL